MASTGEDEDEEKEEKEEKEDGKKYFNLKIKCKMISQKYQSAGARAGNGYVMYGIHGYGLGEERAKGT